MGVYIKNWSLADWKELLKWAKIGANNAMIGEFAEVEEIPPHGRLIDADEFFKDICNSLNEMTAIGIAVDGEWMWGKLNDALGNAPTIIPAEEDE
jgi:hypothetical protein